jgi:hypothetical protein
MANSRNRCWFARHAKTDAPTSVPGYGLILILMLVVSAPNAIADPGSPQDSPGGQETLCAPASEGFLHMRLQGAVDADIKWDEDTAQCLGGPRPGGDGIRLLYKGETASGEPLLIVIGAGPLFAGQSARHVGVNMTVVLEGSGQFYSTRGDEKCAFDEIEQESVPPHAHRYRVSGRGYCTQPARAVGGDSSVFVSRFDLLALVDFPPAEPETTAEVSAE